MEANTIYDELLAREYGALVLRDIIGRNMIRGVIIASLSLCTILGGWWGYEFIKEKMEGDDSNAKVIYIDPTKLALPPSLADKVVEQLKIEAPKVAPPTIIKARAVEDTKVADTVQIMTVKEIAQQIDKSGVQAPTGAGSGDVVVAPPPEEDYVPKMDEFVAVEKEPEPISSPPPIYPEGPRNAGVRGQVIVSFLVNKKGDVTQAKVLKAVPANLGFEEAAITAVKAWKFKPAINNGQPVAIWVTQPIRFTLK